MREPNTRENSLFCFKGLPQFDQVFCENFNSYKVKFFLRRWDKESKKTKEIYLGSKCADFKLIIKIYSILYKVKKEKHGV